MALDRTLRALFDLICDEARRNQEFRNRLELLLAEDGAIPHSKNTDRVGATPSRSAATTLARTETPALAKRGNRRPPAVVDPIVEGIQGEAHLREKLTSLTLEQLRDIIADFRMDQSKLVMKWKDRERVVDHIVATALSRREKGDAFRA